MAALAAIAACAVAFAWVHGDKRRLAPILRALRAVLAASMLTTVGILLALGGGPFFLVLLLKGRKGARA